MITLLSHLKQKYEAYLQENKLTQIVPTEGMSAFIQWAEKYLDQYRPARIGHGCEMNYSVTLQDGEEVLISPAFGVDKNPGAMQGGSPSVPISGTRERQPMGGDAVQM